MIEKFTEFFLKNQKITWILILMISLFGLLAYILLPKQYNPSIVAPAFLIEVPTEQYSAKEGHEYIIKTLENKIYELVGVDDVFGYSTNGFVSLMVAFEVGVKQEDAKTRLYDKLYSNMELRPYGINTINIRSIDPEELPQVTYAITYSGSDLSTSERGQYLRNIAKILQEHIKKIDGTTTIEIIGGYSNDISIEIIPEKIESFGLDFLMVQSKIQKSFGKYMIGNLKQQEKNRAIFLDKNTDDLESLKNLLLSEENNKKIYLRDVANIRTGPINISTRYRYSNPLGPQDAVFLGVAKLKGTNAVHIVESVHKTVQEVQKTLPKNISIITIQDEGETARHATNELMLHLFVSIAIVLVILIIFLGVRDAINAAFCIPMVLGIVFIVALILGLDINRITLFALILSLGILVDDSIVMVENNARHLSLMAKTGKSKYEAILDSVREVGISIILSTITRIISFVAMFAVTGMMGDYMKPIPIFASIALTASLIVAFSINPFLASILHKENHTDHTHENESGFLKWYGEKLQIFIRGDARSEKRRTWLKIGFWISLLIIIVSPIFLDIFKARMLPKADKNQVYLWIDAPRNANIELTSKIARDTELFFLGYKKEITSSGKTELIRLLPPNLQIVDSLNISIGDRFMPDFANLFRGGNNRVMEHQISIRINLEEANMRDMTSEEFVIHVRPLLQSYLGEKYKDIKMRLLEDPPGPPTQATFHIKIQGDEGTQSSDLIQLSQVIQSSIEKIADQEKIVDITLSHSTTSPSYTIELDHERIHETGLSMEQIEGTLRSYFRDTPINIKPYEDGQYGAANIFLTISRKYQKNRSDIEGISFINSRNERIYLRDIATIETTFIDNEIYTDTKSETIHLFAEMGDNSVIYPIIHLYGQYGEKDFEKSGFKKVKMTPYRIEFEQISTGKKFQLIWGGEWELTMDTFRDLGIAMIFSLFIIYFIIVTQFGSFIVGGIVMTTFLLSFFGIFPGFSLLYLLSGTYFTATAMIGAIALGGIVVGNALILIDYINQLIHEGKNIEEAVIEGSKKRFIPVMLTSIAAVAGSFIITSDPVWSGLAWSIIWGLSASAVLTLYLIPIFYYTYLKQQNNTIIEHLHHTDHHLFSGIRDDVTTP